MDQNVNNTPVQQPNNMGADNQNPINMGADNQNPINMGANNQNPLNKLSLGNAKGCFGLSRAAIIGIIALLVLGMWGCGQYNDFVEKDQDVENAWAKVQNQYQRRIDLFKNLTKTVKAAASHEKETQLGVTQARAQQKMQAVEATADSLSAVGKKLNPEDEKALNDYAKAQQRLSEQMQIAINVVHEAYPDLKANENFLAFQTEIESTENRVSTARNDFIKAATDYNKATKRFPGNIMAKIFGFKERDYFQAQEGADIAPDIDL
ncbi:MAG: LemA family protein [Muribaculaceae bacterium]|nr:LemA family protein [Muribaculaceae bacterium]